MLMQLVPLKAFWRNKWQEKGIPEHYDIDGKIEGRQSKSFPFNQQTKLDFANTKLVTIKQAFENILFSKHKDML